MNRDEPATDGDRAAVRNVSSDSAAMLDEVQMLCGQARDQLAELQATTQRLRKLEEAIIHHQQRLQPPSPRM